MDRIPSRRLVPLFALGMMVVSMVGGVPLASVSASSTPVPTTAPPGAYRAVVTRPADGGVDVVLVGADGRERVLRHVTPGSLGIDLSYSLSPYGTVSQQGWLELWTDDNGSGLERYGLDMIIDLADPDRSPIVVTGNGFMGGRFGPDGRWAHYDGGPISYGPVTVFDPDQGVDTAITVPHVQTFGGTPSMIWAADGSGFLARPHDQWGVTPLDGGPFVPGIPAPLVRWLGPLPFGAAVPRDLGPPDSSRPVGQLYEGQLHATDPVASLFSSDGHAVWQLFDDPDGMSPRALLAKLTGPDEVASVQIFAVPTGPVGGFVLSADDAFAAIYVGDWDPEGAQRFVLVPTGPDAAVVTTGPAIEGHLAGLVPAEAADHWPGR